MYCCYNAGVFGSEKCTQTYITDSPSINKPMKDKATTIPNLIAGIRRFQAGVFAARVAEFEALAVGQKPAVAWLTCTDSRLDPCLLTQTAPGELFVSRNVGNIIPPHCEQTSETAVAVEYAIQVLQVQHIVVCGHSDCGAMRVLLQLEQMAMPQLDASLALPHVHNWLEHSRAALESLEDLENPKHSATNRAEADASDASDISDSLEPLDPLRALTEANILLQLQHLQSHPSVAAACARGALQIHGWFYDIGSGEVWAADDARRAFYPL